MAVEGKKYKGDLLYRKKNPAKRDVAGAGSDRSIETRKK